MFLHLPKFVHLTGVTCPTKSLSIMLWRIHSFTPLGTQDKADSKAAEPTGTREAAALRLRTAEETLKRVAAARPKPPVLWRAGQPQGPHRPQSRRDVSPADLPLYPVSQRPCSADAWGGQWLSSGQRCLRRIGAAGGTGVRKEGGRRTWGSSALSSRRQEAWRRWRRWWRRCPAAPSSPPGAHLGSRPGRRGQDSTAGASAEQAPSRAPFPGRFNPQRQDTASRGPEVRRAPRLPGAETSAGAFLLSPAIG